MGLIPAASSYESDQSEAAEQMSTIFAFNKTCVSFSREILQHTSRGPHPEGLYVINGQGVLSEFTLQVQGVKINGRLNDQSVNTAPSAPQLWAILVHRGRGKTIAPVESSAPAQLDRIVNSSSSKLATDLGFRSYWNFIGSFAQSRVGNKAIENDFYVE